MKKKLLVSACLLGLGCRYDGKEVGSVDLSPLYEKYDLIPVCPEIYGGLPTPRTPSERVGDRVLMRGGADVTAEFSRGAEYTLKICEAVGAELALLKEKSPSCGCGVIYDGSFTGALVPGLGVTAERLISAGISVFGESEIEKLLSRD